MPPFMTKRIINEIEDVKKDKGANLSVMVPNDSDIYHCIGSIEGPPDTPYEGGIFLLDIKLHEQHPFASPTVKFITKVFHPNISSQTGAICLDVLKENWSPAMTMRLTLLSIQSLLESPDPSSPQDFEVAKVYTRDYSEFKQVAKTWTKQYANVTLEEYSKSHK